MGDLTKNFSRKEFECRCGCGTDCINLKLVDLMQNLRDFVEKELFEEYRFIIHSGVRCLDHNRDIGSKDSSQHTYREHLPPHSQNRPCACDFRAESVESGKRLEIQKLYQICKKFDKTFEDIPGIGVYRTHIHIDVRKGHKARWFAR